MTDALDPVEAPRRFMSIAEAARRAQRSEDTIQRWLREGRLTKYTRNPREVWIDVDELDRYREMTAS